MKILNQIPDCITNLITDSRRITPSNIESNNTAFVALRTAVGDGHRYVRDLYRKGLRTFVVDDYTAFQDLCDACFIVSDEDTLDFLIATAGKRLQESGARQIVVTGSNKKTTAKELITEALREKGEKVARSPRTWNSAMGIALSLFDNLAGKSETIVTEAGIDAPGQSERIAPMLRADIGIITSITDEHDEAFESHASKIAEKIKIVHNARKIIYVKGDKELERQIKELNHANAVGVGNLKELVEEATGNRCPDTVISTKIEVRRTPEDGVLFIDSFTNDLESLLLSLSLASHRQAGRGMAVFLGDFYGDKEKARKLTAERGGDVYFFSKKDKNFTDSLVRKDFAHKLVLIKGGNDEITTFFDEARHDTTLEVDLDALVNNYNVYRRLLPPDTGIIGMVKADAYGLGALEVAKTLQSHGAAYLAVAVVDEGIALRRAGVTMPIIVLNPITNRFDAIVEYNLEPTIFSLDELERIEAGLKNMITEPIPVHIKFDTGMHRVGFNEEALEELGERLKASESVYTSSVFSHLATADCPELADYTQSQTDLFDRMSGKLIRYIGKPVRRHLLNTAGIATLGSRTEYEMARLGIGLYGISPVKNGKDSGLKPVGRLVSTIISLKEWPEGTPIGYGCKGKTKRQSFIATLPIGYADGIDRRLGNGNASFVVGGVKCPTIGNICMDLLMLDVTDAVKTNTDVGVGTEVEIFGPSMPVEIFAEQLGTIPYEILTSISPRVRRSYHHR